MTELRKRMIECLQLRGLSERTEEAVHSEPVGTGEAAFKYLAPYVFRVAISNNRIVKLEDGRVTFKYKDSPSDETRFRTLSAEEFMRRFLQHVLPERFVKVRYYGLLAGGNRLLRNARELLRARTSERGRAARSEQGGANRREAMRCPNCGSEMMVIGPLSARGRHPP